VKRSTRFLAAAFLAGAALGFGRLRIEEVVVYFPLPSDPVQGSVVEIEVSVGTTWRKSGRHVALGDCVRMPEPVALALRVCWPDATLEEAVRCSAPTTRENPHGYTIADCAGAEGDRERIDRWVAIDRARDLPHGSEGETRG